MNKFSILIRLIRFTAPYKAKIILLVALGFIGVGFDVLKPLPVKYIIDNVLSDHPVSGRLQDVLAYLGWAPDKSSLLVALVGASVVLVIAASTLSFISTQLVTRVCQRLVYDFSARLFDKFQQLSLAFFSRNKIGDLMQRLSGDTYVIYSIVGGIMLPTLMALASLTAMFTVMANINWSLALLAISVVPVFALLLYVFRKPMTDAAVHQSEVSGKLWSFIQQSLSSVKIIQAYSMEEFTRQQYRDQSRQYNNASLRSTKISMIYNSLLGVVSGVALAVIVGIGAAKGLRGEITTGELFLFISYIGALFGPVNSLANIIATTFTITARAKRIFDILDSHEVLPEKPDARALSQVTGTVEFRNIVFGYNPAGAPIIEFERLQVPAGKIAAIVGPTGAGKTSLISLLLRFYDPWNGDIFIDGTNIRDIKLKSLRENISLVLQDAFIFPISIADNIAFGKPGATRDEIVAAAKAAQAHDFIVKTPDGYDTIPSEGGVSLSGGEKQRIALARAFLRDAPILVLDEPTSALDVHTEARIFKALATYARGRTVFMISHRLSAIKYADLVISVKDGQVTEKSGYEQLLKDG